MTKPDDDEFWQPLGKPFWDEAAKTTGATELQVRFACCRHRGMTASGAARAAGYGGSDENLRQTGSRTAKSSTIMNLLALAAAEAGGGDEGTVRTGEAKRILSRLARGSDPNVRIKALESLSKLEAAELAANRQDEPTDPMEFSRLLIEAIPALGPALALGLWFNHAGWINEFPFLQVVAPYLARNFPADWQRWRGTESDAFLDSVVTGPVLTPDQITAALKTPAPKKLNGGARHSAPPEQEAAHAGA
jgi:hypothetical protein